MSRTKEINTEPCKICGVVIRYKGDVARHEQLHKPNDAVVMFNCPYEGCAYRTLQKSNLNTHLFTHTGEKPHACPDCDYRTADPGCLTRHRKRKHAYVPNRKTGKVSTATKQSRRHTPYKHKEVAPSPRLTPASELLPEDHSAAQASTYPNFCTFNASCGETQDNRFTYTWDKCLFPLEGTSPPLELFASLDFPSSGLSPAVDTCSQLFGGVDYCFDVMDLFSQCPRTICLAETYLTESAPVSSNEDLSWIFDSPAIQTADSASAHGDGCYGSPGSLYSPDFHSSPASSASPQSYFSDFSTDTSLPSSFSSSPASGGDCNSSDFMSSTSLPNLLIASF